MRFAWFMLIVLVLLSCAKPPSLKPKLTPQNLTNFSAARVQNETAHDVSSWQPSANNSELPDSTFKSNDTASQPEAITNLTHIPQIPADRVDVRLVTLGGNHSEITAMIKGTSDKFSLPEIDPDAIIYDVAKRYGQPLKTLRYIIYFNGNPYLKPTQSRKTADAIANVQQKSINPTDIPLAVEKNNGFIQALGCSLEKNLLRIVLKNDGDLDIKLYRDVHPRIKGALVLTLNKKVLEDIYCAGKDVLKAGGVLDCIKSNVVFVRTRQKNELTENATDAQKVKDQLAATYPGYSEKIEFDCELGMGDYVPATDTSSTDTALSPETNSTMNQTVKT